MRVLVIDEWIPLPLNSGKRIRTFQLLAPHARRHEMVYLCYADAQAEAAKIRQMEEAGFRMLCVPPVPRFNTPFKAAVGFGMYCMGRTPLAVRKQYSRGFQEALRRILAAERFDLIHCEWTHYAHFLRGLPEMPRFLCSHNVESVPWERLYRVERNPLRRAALHLEWLKMRSFERRAVARFDHVAAVSAVDAEMLRTQFGARSVEVIPNGVDLDFYACGDRRPQEEILAYCGSMDSFVNQDAVRYFVEKIFPAILARRPHVRFMIIGRSPPRSIRDLANDRIMVSGNVEDIRPLLSQVTVGVVPLRVAGGSRLKILEAFAAGIPLVSTSIGAEGLDLQPGTHLLAADDEASFAEACLRLLGDSQLRTQLAGAARIFLGQRYDWKSISPRVEAAWEHTRRAFAEKGHVLDASEQGSWRRDPL